MSPLTTAPKDAAKPNNQERSAQSAREGQSAQAGFAPLSATSHLLTPNNMLVLQRAMGNQAIVRMLRGQSATGSSAQAGKAPRGAIQPKLQVGPVNDPFEREADEMAAQVMRKPIPSQVQRDHEEEEEESVQTKRSEVQRHHDEDAIQTKRSMVQRHFPNGGAPRVHHEEHEEEAVQPKRSVVQRMEGEEEEDESVQLKRSDVQRMEGEEEEDESVQLKRAVVQRHHHEDEAVQTKRHWHPTKNGAAVQRSTGNHRSGCGCGSCHQVAGPEQIMKVQRASHSPGCGCPDCAGVQRSAPDVKKDGSFEADDNLSSQVRKLQGGGRPLPDKVRGDMEQRFNTDFSGVRVHTGSDAVQMNRSMSADAFTYRQNIAFNAGKYSPGSSSGQRLLAHELTHTIQQTGGLQRKHSSSCKCTNCNGVKRKADPNHDPSVRRKVYVSATGRPAIQRHSSWEHKALGDIKPDDLAVLGVYEEMKEANKQAKKAAGWFKKPDPNSISVQVGAPLNRNITLPDFLHVIQQEIDRLKTFRDHPPTAATAAAEQELADRVRIRQVRKELQGEFGKRQFRQKTREDYQYKFNQKMQAPIPVADQWQVKLIAIDHVDAANQDAPTGLQTIITYGEMNTLGDFAGDPIQLARMSPDKLQPVINGIRQQSMIRFMRLRDQVKGKKTEKKNYWGQGFKNTAGSTGRGPIVGDTGIGTERYGKLGSESVGQLRLMIGNGVKIGKDATTSYDAGLARNACHFAPESWITWEKYHREAVRLAGLSVVDRWLAQNNPGNQQAHLASAEENKSKALIQNGFADHFLQDSFAAGHLINKDEIMKWYQLWLANDSTWNAKILQHMTPNTPTSADLDPSRAGGVDVTQKHGIGAWRRWDYMKNKQSKRNTALIKTQPGLGVEAARYDMNNVGGANPLEPKNMQGVENMGGNWQGRFAALGLQVPESLQEGNTVNTVLKGWQKLAGRNKDMVKITVNQYMTARNLPGGVLNHVQGSFDKFVRDGVARKAGKHRIGANKGQDIYELRKQYQLTDSRTKWQKFTRQDKQLTNINAGQNYNERAQKAVYKDYHAYMNNAALQASTNILHDHFCEKGLKAQAHNGDFIGHIYGDDAMFKRDSARGVKYSGDTSNMSRDSIYMILNEQPAAIAPGEPNNYTTDDIKGRFPTHVTDANGANAMRLDDWHERGPLKALCEKVIFPAANRNFFKTFVGGGKSSKFGASSKGGLTPQISKDTTVHQGALF